VLAAHGAADLRETQQPGDLSAPHSRGLPPAVIESALAISAYLTRWRPDSDDQDQHR
jgi:hypothetical protein